MIQKRIDEWGRVVVDSSTLIELFFQDKEIGGDIIVEDTDDVREYNKWCQVYDNPDIRVTTFSPLPISPSDFHSQRAKDWNIPHEFKTFDIEQWLYDQCSTDEQLLRVDEELQIFKKNDLLPVLRTMKYIVDTLTKEGIVWGVGRGSSVASYCLYLIGVHKVDSIAYGLDIGEFLHQ